MEEGDYEGLVKIMVYLREVEAYKVKSSDLFKPIEERIELLKIYGYVFPYEIYYMLSVSYLWKSYFRTYYFSTCFFVVIARGSSVISYHYLFIFSSSEILFISYENQT